MLGSAVSSRTPTDRQPSSVMGVDAEPLMTRYAISAPLDIAYTAVGMQSALDAAIGLPSNSTSASEMLAFFTPADVSRSFTVPFGWSRRRTLQLRRWRRDQHDMPHHLGD